LKYDLLNATVTIGIVGFEKLQDTHTNYQFLFRPKRPAHRILAPYHRRDLLNPAERTVSFSSIGVGIHTKAHVFEENYPLHGANLQRSRNGLPTPRKQDSPVDLRNESVDVSEWRQL
jgi:hypothetical protein